MRLDPELAQYLRQLSEKELHILYNDQSERVAAIGSELVQRCMEGRR